MIEWCNEYVLRLNRKLGLMSQISRIKHEFCSINELLKQKFDFMANNMNICLCHKNELNVINDENSGEFDFIDGI